MPETRSASLFVPLLAAALLLGACSGGGDAAPQAAPASLQRVLSAAPAAFNGHGTWWNPAEPGSGFVFEAQGATGVITYFTYDAAGKAVWYSGAGAFGLRDDGKYAFSATLFKYSGGQPAGSATPRTPVRTEAGTTTVVFDGDSAQVTIPGRTYAARKFNATTAAGGNQPEAGIYWNPAESGRGYTMEVAGNVVSIGVFHYDAAGEPTWHLVVGDMATGRVSAPFTAYSGGQVFGGAYRPPAAGATTQQFQANFASACRGEVQFPGMAPVAVSRFPFGGLPQGAECRSAAAAGDGCSSVVQGFTRGNIETTPADAGYAGGDGGTGGDGGGAAAGGGLGKVLAGLVRVTDLSDGSVVGEAVTDGRDGLVTVKTCKRPGPFLVTMEGRAGAQYFDEGLNQFTEFGPGQVLHALVDQWDEHVGVSPLTEAAYRYALNNFQANAGDIAAGRTPLRASGAPVGLSKAQVVAANGVVAEEVNNRLTDGFRLPSVKTLPTPIDMTSSSAVLRDTRHGRSAVVNGGLVKAAHNHNAALAAPALAFAQDLARDLTDGRINGFALDGSQVAAADRTSYESVRLPRGGQFGLHEIARRFAAQAFGDPAAEVDEWEWLSGVGAPVSASPGVTRCDQPSFSDQIGLMGDGSVTVERVRYVRPDGSCRGSNEVGVFLLKNYVTAVKQIAASTEGIAYAVRQDGSVVGWGENLCGAMGPGLPYAIYDEPQVIAGLRDITSIATHDGTTLARDRAGRVYIWGIDEAATSTSTTSAVPGRALCASSGSTRYFRYAGITQVPGLANVVKVYTRLGNHFALTADGRLYAWGSGSGGRLANGGSRIDTPAPIAGLTGVRDLVFAGGLQFALRGDGSVHVWGRGGQGAMQPTPVAAGTFTGVRELGAAGGSVYLLKNDGSTWAWPDTGTTLDFGTLRAAPASSPVRHVSGQNDGVELAVFFRDGRLGLSFDYRGDARGVFR